MENNEYRADDVQQKVLDAYFSVRWANGSDMKMYALERKTTAQIHEELIATLDIDDDIIVDYMIKGGFVLAPDDDGSPIWQIYRLR